MADTTADETAMSDHGEGEASVPVAAEAEAEAGAGGKRKRTDGDDDAGAGEATKAGPKSKDVYLDMTLEHAREDNIYSCNIESEVPEICKTEPCWLGIDEAGRGPVCGPMVYGCAYSPISGEKRLKGIGFADSKKLTEAIRDRLFKDIKACPDFIGWLVTSLTPQDISASMLGKVNYNLNAMSHDTAIDMIKRVLAMGVQLTEVYVDTVGKEEIYQAKLEELFPNLKITVCSKCDDLFTICSAASICAKVTRDQIISNWEFRENVQISREWGSGYPADPYTKTWIANHRDPVFGFPGFVRFSWGTAKKAMKESCATVEWEDDSDDDEDTPSVMTFFRKKDAPARRHRFFDERCLATVTEF